MSDFKLYADADISDRELDNARRLRDAGEITEQTFLWLVGLIDLEEDLPFHRMSAAQKRRFFAKQKADMLGGLNLFGRPSKLGRKRRAKK